jgi:hypothetical protein
VGLEGLGKVKKKDMHLWHNILIKFPVSGNVHTLVRYFNLISVKRSRPSTEVLLHFAVFLADRA